MSDDAPDADAGGDPDRDDADGYVHRPDGEPPAREDGSPTFDWRGWTLVGGLVIAFFLVPGAILFLPAGRDVIAALGLTLRDAYLTLPLVPAFLLGALAVWSAVRSRSA